MQSWDETARFNNLLARLSILLVRRPPHLPHLLLRPCQIILWYCTSYPVNFSPASGFDKASHADACTCTNSQLTSRVSSTEHCSYLSRADLMQGSVGWTLIALLPHLILRLVSLGSWNSSSEVTSLDRCWQLASASQTVHDISKMQLATWCYQCQELLSAVNGGLVL